MFILGDIHGYSLGGFDHLKFLIKTRISDSNIIQVGDFGMSNNIVLMTNTLIELNRLLGESGNKLYVIRGNHDNPAFWNGTHIYEHLELVPDYETRVIEDKTVLFVGGAISIDRVDRIKVGHPYWVDEVFVLDEDKLKGVKGVDIVVTHSSPRFAFPQTIGGVVNNYIAGDPTLIQELGVERFDHTVMYDILKENNDITDWYYGHFHTNKLTLHEGVRFRVVGVKDTHHLRTEAEYGN